MTLLFVHSFNHLMFVCTWAMEMTIGAGNQCPERISTDTLLIVFVLKSYSYQAASIDSRYTEFQ